MRFDDAIERLWRNVIHVDCSNEYFTESSMKKVKNVRKGVGLGPWH